MKEVTENFTPKKITVFFETAKGAAPERVKTKDFSSPCGRSWMALRDIPHEDKMVRSLRT